MNLGDLPADPRRDFAADVVAKLVGAGHQALWAGGCVRDLLLGLEPADYDVATDARPEAVIRLFRRTVPVGVSFGVVRVIGPKPAGEVEVATFRSDGEYLDGRRPESVTFGSAEADASRRDFTINGMFLDPMGGEVRDYVGGLRDLENRVLSAIGEPEARFAEDKLRLLRAVRFASRFELAIEPATRAAIEAMAPQVRQVSAERIAKELRVMLTSRSRSQAMSLAGETGLLAAVLPDLKASPGEWDRTLQVLGCLLDGVSFPVAMAAILLDTGREVAERVARDLKFANAERERIAWLVGHRAALEDPERLRIAPLKKLLNMPGIGDLLTLHRATADADRRDRSHVEYCERYLKDQPDGPIHPPPLLTGADLQQEGWKPGPDFKKALDAVYDAQLEGAIGSKPEALAWLAGRFG